MRKQERERNNFIHTQNYGSVMDNYVNHDILDLMPEEVKDTTKELGDIKELLCERTKQQATERERMDDHDNNLVPLLPEAMWMLNTGDRRKKVFTKKHMRSILALCFGVAFPRNNTRRDVLLAELEKRIASHPEKLVSA